MSAPMSNLNEGHPVVFRERKVCRSESLDGCEIDLLSVDVDAVHDDIQTPPDPVGFSFPAADENEADGIEDVEIILQPRDVDDAGEQDRGQLDDEAEALDIDDNG